MKINEKKSKLSTIALILVLAISATLVALPTVIGVEDIPPRTTYAFIGATPNPVGVNQDVLLHVGITTGLQSVKMGWDDLSITIERPDGQTDTISDIRTDSTGGTGRVYTPTMAGTYKIQSHFPEQITTDDKVAFARFLPAPIGMVMLADSSDVLEVEVQNDPVTYYPDQPLPAEYWGRPIDAQLRSWHAISGSWLSANRRAPQFITGNADAPDSAHILWTKEMTLGGIAGGDREANSEWAFSHGDAYEGKWESRLIINGILIYLHRNNDIPREYTAVDIHTGEEMWKNVFLDNRSISFGQDLVWAGYNHHAVYSYIWVTVGSTWYAFDPYTAKLEFTVENVPSGSTITDDQGWIYRYSFSVDEGTGSLWSMTHLIVPFGVDSPAAGSWPPAGSFYSQRYATYDAAEMDDGELSEDAQRAYVSEFTIPSGLSGRVRAVKLGDKVVGSEVSNTEVRTWAFSLEPGKEGDLLYDKTWTAPAEWESGSLAVEHNAISIDNDLMVVRTGEDIKFYGFSTETGDYLWVTAGQHYLNYYGIGGERTPIIAYGKFFSSGISGIIYCNDAKTGQLLWSYEVQDEYSEILWTNAWWQYLLFATDGKLYSGHLEHSAIEPMPRGGPFLCIDVESGDVVWRADGLFRQTMWGGLGIIGDSIIATMDTYDNRIYAVGKGPSAITVEKPQAVVELGSAITLHGTVMDVSPGTKDTILQARFPNGVPAVSDASMSDWMLYVYKNFKRPADATGVTVKLEAVDPNNEYVDIGTTTSDAYGNYGLAFEPDIEGTYMIIATFTGSGAYYGSTQTSYLTAADPIPTEVDLTPIEDSISDMEDRESNQTTYILATLVVGILALLIAVYLLLKSRK